MGYAAPLSRFFQERKRRPWSSVTRLPERAYYLGMTIPAVRIERVPDGFPGVLARLRLMARLAGGEASSATVQALAIRWGLASLSFPAALNRLRQGLRRAVPFRPDMGYEVFFGPRFVAEHILTAGTFPADCDDVAMLGSALARAVGWRAWMLAVELEGEPAGVYGHVYAIVAPPGLPKNLTAKLVQDNHLDVNRPTSVPAVRRWVSVPV